MTVEANNREKMLITNQCCDKSQTKPLLIDKVFFRSNGCWTDVRDGKFEMSHYRQIYKQIVDKQVI